MSTPIDLVLLPRVEKDDRLPLPVCLRILIVLILLSWTIILLPILFFLGII